MTLEQISGSNGLWAEMLQQWEKECVGYGEAFEDYASASIPTLSDLALAPERATARVYGLRRDGRFDAIAQLNVGLLPGYDDKVVRVRHIVAAPRFDFDETHDIDAYGTLLAQMFAGGLKVSEGEMKAPYVKFHFRSPAERIFFQAFKDALKDSGVITDIEMRGSWLYVKK